MTETGVVVYPQNQRKSSDESPLRRGLSPFLLFPALVLEFLPLAASTRLQEKPAQPLKQDEACLACHGPGHKIQPSGEADSKVAKKNQPGGCAHCHADPGFLSRHKIPVLHPVDQYLQSVHGRAVLQGKNAAICVDCHGGHGILPAREAQSTVSHWVM
jgi:hypothetical protein